MAFAESSRARATLVQYFDKWTITIERVVPNSQAVHGHPCYYDTNAVDFDDIADASKAFNLVADAVKKFVN
jgi:hypothetical protein